MIVNENKIMDKINKNLKIIDNLLIENGFYKYISKVVNTEDGISQLYDNLKQLQQENARLKDKMKELQQRIDKAIEYIENNTYSSVSTMKTTLHLQNEELYDLLEILKGGNK